MTWQTLLLGVLILLSGSTVTLAASPNGATPEGSSDYLIGPEDVLDISVWNNTAISRTVPVRPDGKISLPLLNDIYVAGLTPMQVRDILTKKLQDYVPAPEISVVVREVQSPKVSVVGEIKTPGRYKLRSRTTVLDVLAEAGPLNEFAGRNRIVILRSNGGGEVKKLLFNYSQAIRANGKQENFVLEPGDIIVIP